MILKINGAIYHNYIKLIIYNNINEIPRVVIFTNHILEGECEIEGIFKGLLYKREPMENLYKSVFLTNTNVTVEPGLYTVNPLTGHISHVSFSPVIQPMIWQTQMHKPKFYDLYNFEIHPSTHTHEYHKELKLAEHLEVTNKKTLLKIYTQLRKFQCTEQGIIQLPCKYVYKTVVTHTYAQNQVHKHINPRTMVVDILPQNIPNLFQTLMHKPFMEWKCPLSFQVSLGSVVMYKDQNLYVGGIKHVFYFQTSYTILTLFMDQTNNYTYRTTEEDFKIYESDYKIMYENQKLTIKEYFT